MMKTTYHLTHTHTDTHTLSAKTMFQVLQVQFLKGLLCSEIEVKANGAMKLVILQEYTICDRQRHHRAEKLN